MSKEDGGRKKWREGVRVREGARERKLVNKQRRWMGLLKQQLIQAIRKQSEGVKEKGDTYGGLMALNTDPKRSEGLLEMIISVPRGVTRNYEPAALEMTPGNPPCPS